MKLTVVYNYPVYGAEHDDYAARFVFSYGSFPPGIEHETVIIVNGGPLAKRMKSQIEGVGILPNIKYIEYPTNEGQDIGGFQWASMFLDCDAAFYCGGPCHFKRAGWLKRMAEAWEKHGQGMYGSMASFLQRPHIQTTGFLTSPGLIKKWGNPCKTREDRYSFEWGMDAFWRMVVSMNMPAMLVTWDGEYPPDRWREPDNCMWRGDQGNCLSYFRHSDRYDEATEIEKKRLSNMADGFENNLPMHVQFRTEIERNHLSKRK